MTINNDIPILIIAFNRVELTQSLIESLREIAPHKIFYSIDGPRLNNDKDLKLNRQLKELISIIDWPCSVETLFSETNFGSGLWPYKSISWALTKSRTIIVLEDDVRITNSFYQLAGYCLNRFDKDKEIFAICASNICDSQGNETSNLMASSKYFSGWGWAIWSDRWEEYKFDINQLKKLSFFSLLKQNNYNFLIALYFWFNFYKVKNNLVKAWDYQINYLLFTTDKKVIKSDRNLSNNKGTGFNATHTKKMPELRMNRLPFNDLNYMFDLRIDPKKEKLWRKSRLIFLIKSLLLRIS
jgi:hypothetical protein